MEERKQKRLGETQMPVSKALTLNDKPAAIRVKSKVKMRVPFRDEKTGPGLAKKTFDNSIVADNNPAFMESFSQMMLATKEGGEWNNEFELAMIQEAMRQMDPPPTPVEVYNAFWKAYGDKYTPKSGVGWKNIANYIKEFRAKCYWPPESMETMEDYQKRKAKKLKSNK